MCGKRKSEAHVGIFPFSITRCWNFESPINSYKTLLVSKPKCRLTYSSFLLNSYRYSRINIIPKHVFLTSGCSFDYWKSGTQHGVTAAQVMASHFLFARCSVKAYCNLLSKPFFLCCQAWHVHYNMCILSVSSSCLLRDSERLGTDSLSLFYREENTWTSKPLALLSALYNSRDSRKIKREGKKKERITPGRLTVRCRLSLWTIIFSAFGNDVLYHIDGSHW